mmetsp:Transcript_47987/g.102762  ORF Transcript_47987/g.102762 Transcript_47987/m.102762 type:complete len:830 (+) Transcript_47987:62-2551(+)|eukprot:CAMPEP_0206435062 /NCGR_PEP_ID=MMETSP0324_2-20121206/9597_1 /ASSEMBLY_ACC=CAM_ASM_000836 /TAXON_ID=2866 /ORGANISM="Crypthecodinium cohnii, Strain Seligo" /LENGTH=829 /DNA_ID=CAMNT_0053901831 /DNA_START=59 /DNA_END=2548 /DNA_ORIENTATION=+
MPGPNLMDNIELTLDDKITRNTSDLDAITSTFMEGAVRCTSEPAVRNEEFVLTRATNSTPELGDFSRPAELRRGRFTGASHALSRGGDAMSVQHKDHSDLGEGPSKASKVCHFMLMMLGATGVVFGDIGTSPLYTYAGIFVEALDDKHPSSRDVVDAFSMIFWSLTLVVGVKYILIVMRVSHHGEGGTFALLQSILGTSNVRPWMRSSVIFVGMLGVSFVAGDGCITPAVSVISALEGIPADIGQSGKVGLSVVILLFIFCMQSVGSKAIGLVAGPVTVLWFLSIAGLGLYNLITRPEAGLQALSGLSPLAFINFWTTGHYRGVAAWRSLAGVVLSVTGAEALYADMGHFGAAPISFAWLLLVYPCLVLQYMGQTAALIDKPGGVTSPFYNAVPEEVIWPVIILATAASVIASQAMISGLFSLMAQAQALKFLPRIKVKHTDPDEKGQIYIPEANWTLCFMCVLIAVIFKSSAKLSGAYGIAVTSTFMLTTTLLFVVLRYVWKWNIILCLVLIVPIFVFDLLLWTANLLKVVQSGWVPMLIASVLCILMATHRRGRLLEERVMHLEHETFTQEFQRTGRIPSLSQICSIEGLLAALEHSDVVRGDRAIVFLTPLVSRVPRTVGALASLLGYVPRVVILLAIHYEEDRPFVTEALRASLESHGAGIYSVVMRFGYAEPVTAEQARIRKVLAEISHRVSDKYPDLNLLSNIADAGAIDNSLLHMSSSDSSSSSASSSDIASDSDLEMSNANNYPNYSQYSNGQSINAHEGPSAAFVLHKVQYAKRPGVKHGCFAQLQLDLYSFMVLNARKAITFFGLEGDDTLEISVVRFL